MENPSSQDPLQGQVGGISAESELSALADRLVRSNKICRLLCRSQSLSPKYPDIIDRVRQQLLVELELQTTPTHNGSNQEGELWLNETLDRVCRQVFDDAALTWLAIVAQQQPPETRLRKEALTILIQAIEFSGKLGRSSGSESQQIVQETLSYVVEKIDRYKPSKGSLMAWALDAKKRIRRRVRASAEVSDMQQSAQAKRIKLKSQLKGLVKKARHFDLWFWLSLEIKGLLPKQQSVQQISLVSLVLALMLLLLDQEPVKANDLLTHIAYECFPLAFRVEESFGEALSIDEVTQHESLLLSELVKEYIHEDPEGLCQEAMQACTQATFRVIALDRLDGRNWEEISTRLGGIPTSSLCGFYTKWLRNLAPRIKAYIQQNH